MQRIILTIAALMAIGLASTASADTYVLRGGRAAPHFVQTPAQTQTPYALKGDSSQGENQWTRVTRTASRGGTIIVYKRDWVR